MKTITLALLTLASSLSLSAHANSQYFHILNCRPEQTIFDAGTYVRIVKYVGPQTTRGPITSLEATISEDNIAGMRDVASYEVVQHVSPERPGAPMMFTGKGFSLSVQATATPSNNGMPAHLEAQLEGGQTVSENMRCEFVR